MNDKEQELAVLQTVRVKGRIARAAVAASLGVAQAELAVVFNRLTASELMADVNGTCRLTPAGRASLALRVAEERVTLDQPGLRAAYGEFDSFNSEFKRIVSAWQMRDGLPNSHLDPVYDAQIIACLRAIHAAFAPLLSRMASLAPRLSHYTRRLDTALAGVGGGDVSWFARPIKDSYHTVWFELHEDLIGLLGLTREAEAAGGRAE